ncbi:MAG: penicillin acylase family protein [Bradymonadia bacterium]
MLKHFLLILVVLVTACDEKPASRVPSPDMGNLTDSSTPDSSDDASRSDLGQANEALERIKSVSLAEEINLDGLDRDVHVLLTEGGVPNLYASHRNDLGHALGFLMARDRYFIMDMQRRLGRGTLSELLGELGLQSDLEARLTGLPYVASQLEAGLSMELRSFLGAFIDGINSYLMRVRLMEEEPPVEFALAAPLLGLTPQEAMVDWSLIDVAAMAAVVMYQTTFDTTDVERTAALATHPTLFAGFPNEEKRRRGFVDDITGDMTPLFDYATTNGFGLNGAIPRDLRPMASSLPNMGRLPAGFSSMVQDLSSALKRVERRYMRHTLEGIGSNVWAVAGDVAQDGYTLVAGDGHLPLSVPAVTYLVGLDTSVLGEGNVHQAGILMAQLPVLGAGTNGQVAWSQVNPYADTVDWYRESIELGEDGLPSRALFKGEWRALLRLSEEYVIADAPLLNSQGQTLVAPRYETFDGRRITDVEGRTIEPDEMYDGPVIHAVGRRVAPMDIDGDGVISAISFDYTAFDATPYLDAADRAGFAQTAEELRQSMRGLIGNGLYTAGGDASGNIFFSAYQGFPCRTHLPRTGSGEWAPGANPRYLIDGTQYGGFTIPVSNGQADESQTNEPNACVIPFDAVPQATNPNSGYVVAANNDPAGASLNGVLYDDPYYLGGPWNSTRSHTIASDLAELVENETASVETMAEVQANRRSRLGEVFTPYLLDAITHHLEGRDDEQDPDILSTARLQEFKERLTEWKDTGYDTPSGVSTFYDAPTDADKRASVATMIFNVWLRQMLNRVWSDEEVSDAWVLPREQYSIIGLSRILAGIGDGNPNELTSWHPDTGESVFFDDVTTPAVETSTDMIILALSDTDAFLSSPNDDMGQAGFGTSDMSKWLWGMRHQARFESLLSDFLEEGSSLASLLDRFAITTRNLPLADDLDPADPRSTLKWFPRGGDHWSVDAANPGMSGPFTHKNGPVMRMVIGLKDGEVIGQNIIPGGQSADSNSPHYSDQLALWLANESFPLRFHFDDVLDGATTRLQLTPTSEP